MREFVESFENIMLEPLRRVDMEVGNFIGIENIYEILKTCSPVESAQAFCVLFHGSALFPFPLVVQPPPAKCPQTYGVR